MIEDPAQRAVILCLSMEESPALSVIGGGTEEQDCTIIQIC